MVFQTASAGNSAQRVFRSLITSQVALTLQVFLPVEKRAVDFHSVFIHALESRGSWEDASSLPQTPNSISTPTSALLSLKPRWILMESLNGLLSLCLVWKPSWKFPLKFAGRSQHNWGLMSYHTPNSSRICSCSHLSPKGRWNRLAQPQFRDAVAQSHGQSTLRGALELCPAVEPVVLGLFLGQAPVSQPQTAMITGTPCELTPSVIYTQFTY